jgi:hypothetical protein
MNSSLRNHLISFLLQQHTMNILKQGYCLHVVHQLLVVQSMAQRKYA